MRQTIIILAVILFANANWSCAQENRLKKLEMYYMTGWLFELPDTIYFFETRDSIPRSTRYSIVRKQGRNLYDLDCMSENWNTIEDPTKIKHDLKIVFNDGKALVKFGGWKKGTYVVIGNRLDLMKK